MSDFVSDFWSVYIAALTVLGIIGCAALLWAQSKKRKSESGELHDHVWDGDLREYNNPLPRWWMWLFYVTIFFSVGYLVLYPGLGSYRGTAGWTSADQYAAERKTAEAQYAPVFAAYAKTDVVAVAGDPAARAIGQRLFLTYCAQCHGSDAGGARGFPSLIDRDWLYGGEPAAIAATIRDGRRGTMPAFGSALGADGVRDVTAYVLSLTDYPSDPLQARAGRKLFATTCAACHGPEAKGNPALGAPNLTDRIWLHGGTPDRVAETIAKGRNSEMPAHKTVLSEAQIHLLSAYVYGLSHDVGK